MKNIATVAGTLGLRLLKVGAQSTAIQKLQETNRKDMKELTQAEKIEEMKQRKMAFKVIDKAEKVELVEKKPMGTRMKEAAKVATFGTGKLFKVGVQSQTIHSLNEFNRDDMKQTHGEATRFVKYNVAPKIKNIKKVEV